MAFDLNSALASVFGGSGYSTGSVDPQTLAATNADNSAGPPLNLPPNYAPPGAVTPNGTPPPPGALTGMPSSPNPYLAGALGTPPPGDSFAPAPTGSTPPPAGPPPGAPQPGGGALPLSSAGVTAPQPTPSPVPPGAPPPESTPPKIATSTGPVTAPGPVPSFTGSPGAGALPPMAPQKPAGPWLSNILGTDPRQNAQFVGSLGAGLKSVGQNWNKPGLAAFAGSAGSAIEGGAHGDTEFFEKTKQAKDEQLKYQAAGEKSKVDQARIKYFQDRLDAIKRTGTVQSRADAWRNSDLGRISAADQLLEREKDNIRKSYDHDLKDAQNNQERDAIRTQMNKEFEQRRKEIYTAHGVDPNAVDKMRTRGKQDNPHEPKTEDEFHAVVKPGEWFKNPSDGRILQRRDAAPPPADAPGGIQATTPADLLEVPDQIAAVE